MRRTFFTAALVVASLWPAGASAQQIKTKEPVRVHSDYQLLPMKLVKVDVVGSSLYPAADIVATLGLKTGQVVTSDTLQEASGRLGATGAFESVQYQFTGLPDGVLATFRVNDNPQVVPAVFDNFVWWRTADLVTTLHKRVPLFRGQLPLSGELVEDVRAALEAALVARGINAKVTALPLFGKTTGKVLFAVGGYPVKIADVQLPGSDHLDGKVRSVALGRVVNTGFTSGVVTDFGRVELLPWYQSQGYLAAKFGDPEIRVLSETPQGTLVGVTIPVTEGQQYKFAGVSWTGNTVVPTQVLADSISLRPGDVANSARLDRDLMRVKSAYGVKGYVGVIPKVNATLDANGTASFAVEINEGTQYRMGNFAVTGVPAERLAAARAGWKLQAGDIYDSSYVARWFSQVVVQLPRNIRWNYTAREIIDDEKHTVDVNVQLVPVVE